VLVRKDDLEPALAVWRKGATIAPDHPELLDGLSRLTIRLKWLDEANEAARRLARLPGWEARGWLLLGEIQGLLESPTQAITALREGLRIDPDARGAHLSAVDYHLLLARNALKVGRIDEATASLETGASPRKTANDPRPEVDWLLSRAYLRKGRISDAVAALRRAGSYRDEHPLVPEPSPYVGSARCVSCHAEVARQHARSRHARTVHHGAELLTLPLPDHPIRDTAAAGVTHTFHREQDRIRIETRAGDQVFNMIVDYAFGTPERAITMTGRDAEKTHRAARYSSYHSVDGLIWDRSLADVPDSHSAGSFRGEPIGVRDGVVRCLYCHVTQSRDFRDPPADPSPGPETADRGIGCERCHGPGENHLAAIKTGFPDFAIVNSGSAPASAIVEQCADCHIVDVPGEVRAAPENPDFVRSPGATLTASRCYTESAGGLSCLTCHDAHRDEHKPAAFFESRCLGCHAPSTSSQKSCRINPTRGCLDCHMPKVPVAVLHTFMTDHFIRVHKQTVR
jgi:Tetratricopeptide repeat